MSGFYDSFVRCAERWPQHVALEIQHRERLESYTYAELRRLAESVGRWIIEKGTAPGTRMAILAENHPRWVAAYLGIMAAACTAVPLDTAFNAEQVTKLVKDSGSWALFCDSKHLQVALAAVAGLETRLILTDSPSHHPQNDLASSEAGRAKIIDTPIRIESDLDSIFAAGPGTFRPVSAAPESVAALLYTSGTTADPKGVMLTHANLMEEAHAVFKTMKIGPDDAVLGVLPLFHSLAQMANLLLPLAAGARVVYLETLNTTELLRALRERGITAFAVVPQFFYLIHERIFKEVKKRGWLVSLYFRLFMRLNLLLCKVGLNAGRVFFGKIHETFGERMRYLITGGSRFEPQIARDFHALGIDVLQAYGLTETSGGAFVTPPGDNVIGSVGKPLPGVEARIIDAKREDGLPASGEIAIRGPIVMKRYWKRPEATAAVLKDGWLLTGDLGYFDGHGNLFITGRKKDIIVLPNGKNIYPEEIEAHYLKTSLIKEICVVGLEGGPGDPGSARLHAVIVPNFHVLRERKIVNAKEVIRFDIEGLSVQLPSTKRIGSYEIWQEDLPRTTTRKLKRFEIERRVLSKQGKGWLPGSEIAADAPSSAQDEAWLQQDDVRRAVSIIREHARTAPQTIRPAANLELDLGLDSMQRVELLVALEQQLGGDVEESRLAEIYTVRELLDAVRESAGVGKTSRVAREQLAGWWAILGEPPGDPDVLALANARPFSEAFFYLATRIVQIFALDRFHLQVHGLEKLPLKGPYIISSNHQSYLDPIILDSVLPWPVFRNMFAVGTSEIFGSSIMRRVARLLRVAVVDPDANLISAMRAGAFGLQHGRILIMYPEGERSIDGTPRVFRKGAAILSIHLQVPIVPVAIDGFYESWPRGQKFQKFGPLKIVFGDPIYPPPESEGSEGAYEGLTAELKQRVITMWNELRQAGSTESAMAHGQIKKTEEPRA
jgi:long-chain acyl-CoA synthetase